MNRKLKYQHYLKLCSNFENIYYYSKEILIRVVKKFTLRLRAYKIENLPTLQNCGKLKKL